MTVGDGEKPNEEYLRGFTAGYQKRVREEIESWKSVIEGGQLLAFGEIIQAVPFAERERKRLDTVKLAHDVGVHGHSARGCPWCDGTALRPGEGRHGCFLADRCVNDPRCDVRGAACNRGEVPAHNGHYGVPDHPFETQTAMSDRCDKCGIPYLGPGMVLSHPETPRTVGHRADCPRDCPGSGCAQNPDYVVPPIDDAGLGAGIWSVYDSTDGR